VKNFDMHSAQVFDEQAEVCLYPHLRVSFNIDLIKSESAVMASASIRRFSGSIISSSHIIQKKYVRSGNLFCFLNNKNEPLCATQDCVLQNYSLFLVVCAAIDMTSSTTPSGGFL
jgi:hypothetical protein